MRLTQDAQVIPSTGRASSTGPVGGTVAGLGGSGGFILPGSIPPTYHGPMETIVAWTSEVPGPWSPIHLAVSAHGVVAVAWLTTADEVDCGPRRIACTEPVVPFDRRSGRAPARRTWLGRRTRSAAVLAGREPELVPVDLRDRPDWDRLVLAEVRRIPLGATAGYGEIARRIGRPGAARAVGGAVGRNPITLLIPCHRVIAGDGTLGGYGGDGWGGREERLAIKRIAPPARRRHGAERRPARLGAKAWGTTRDPISRRIGLTVAVAPAPSMFAVFRKRDFRLIWLAQLISTAGSSLTDLAAGIWVYRETGSALAVGLTLMATAVPSLVVGLLAGVYVDRHDRRADHADHLPHPIGDRRRSSRSRSRSTRSSGCTSSSCSTPASSSSSTPPTTA